MRIYMKEVLAAFPQLRRSGPYLYKSPVREVLVGFTVEFPPGGPRLRALRLPLYEWSGSIHLDYSPELASFLPNGTPPDHARWASPERMMEPLTEEELQAIWPRKMSKEAERAFAGRLISHVQQDWQRLEEREELSKLAESLRPRARAEPNFKKTLALTLVMLGELDEARGLVVDLLGQADEFSETEKVELRETLRSIEAGADTARRHRLDVIEQMRSRFSLGH